MNLPVFSLIFAVAMIMITKAPLALAMSRQREGYNNRNPRAQQSELSGFGHRALGAHQNSIEALPVFATSLLAALLLAPEHEMISILCATFITCRIVYTLAYWSDHHLVRSTFWSIGYASCLGLLFLAW